MAQTYDINIKLNVDDSELQSASSSLQDLESNAEAASDALGEMSDADLAYIMGEIDDMPEGFYDIEEAADSASESIQGMGDAAEESASKTEESATNTANAMDGIAQAAVGIGAAMGLSSMIDTAGNIEASWDRLSITFGGVTEGMKSAINDASTATGRSGGSIREYFNSMGIAGIRNTDLLNQSFQALSGKAFQTGADVNQLGNLVQKMALSGNAGARQLTMLGISTDQLGAAMGVAGTEATKAFKNLSQEQRLTALTKAMGDGTQANEAYKTSWEGVKEQAGNAIAGLMGAVGSTILPLVIPAVETARNVILGLKDVFTSLPAPVQGVIGVLGGLLLGATAIGGAMAVITPIITGIIGGFGTLTGIISALAGAESIGAAASGVLAAAMGSEAVAATGAGGAFGFLGAMELTALWPILAIIAAVAGLVVAFEQLGEWLGWWDSFGGMLESIRNNVMRLWDAFVNSKTVQAGIQFVKSLFDWLWSGISPIFDAISSAWDYIFGGTGGGNPDAIGAIIDAFSTLDTIISTVINNIQAAIGFIIGLFLPIISGIQMITATIGAMFTGQIGILDGLLMIGQTIMNMYMAFWGQIGALFMQGLQALWSVLSAGLTRLWNSFLSFLAKLAGLPGRVGTYLMGVVGRVTSWASSMVGKAGSAASQFVSRFTSGLSSLPSKVASGLGQVLSAVGKWGSQMISKAGQIAGDFVNKIKSLPGNILNGAELNLGLNYGFNGGTTSNYGFDTGSSLNTSLARSSSNSNTQTVNNNFNINGLIEETASEYIVKAVNDNIRKQNLIRGV